MAQKITKALVVDDSRLARIALCKLLKNRGIEVDMAGNGGEAISYLDSNRPDVMFMDFMMPDMDGFEATRRVLEHPTCAKPPVVMYTSQDTDEDRAKASELGIRGFLGKPSSEQALDDLLRALESAGPVAAVAPPRVAAPTAPLAAAISAEPIAPAIPAPAPLPWEEIRGAARDAGQQAAQRVSQDIAERVARERMEGFRDSLDTALRQALEQAREAAREQAERIVRAAAAEAAPAAAPVDLDAFERSVRELVEQAGRQAAVAAEAAAARAGRQSADDVAAPLREELAELREQLEAGASREPAAAGLDDERAAELRQRVDDSLREFMHGGELRTQVKGIVFEHALPNIQQALLPAAEQAGANAAAAAADEAVQLQLEGLEQRLRELAAAEAAEQARLAARGVRKAAIAYGIVAGLIAGALTGWLV